MPRAIGLKLVGSKALSSLLYTLRMDKAMCRLRQQSLGSASTGSARFYDAD